MPRRPSPPFTPQERELIRLEMGMRFGQYPELANGLFLRTWRAGPHKGEPKIPKVIQGMIDRGLIEVRRNPTGQQAAFFTEAGLAGLRQLLQDRGPWTRSASLTSGRNSRSMKQERSEDQIGHCWPDPGLPFLTVKNDRRKVVRAIRERGPGD